VNARLSLRLRATLLGTVVFAALLAVGSILLVSTLESRLTDASDQVSRARVEDLLALARTGDLPPTLRNVGDNRAAQVVGPDHTVLAASPNLGGRAAIADLRPGRHPRLSTFEAPDDGEIETYRFWYASGPSANGTVTVYVGDSLESVTEASAALRRSLWIGVPSTVLLLGLVIWLLIRRALGRLDRIRAEVDRISETNLHARVAGDGVDDEVGRLAATMNAMLDRLDTASRRQRDFVADVSHDLQSPLTTQRVTLEVELARPSGIDPEVIRTDVLGATADMEALVRDLLVLSNLDADIAPEPSPLDLDLLVLEEATRARSRGRVRIETVEVSAAPAYANADDVRRITRNLLDNAAFHAQAKVDLMVDSHDGWARMIVADDGPGVAPEHRERIFDRFYRTEAARPRDGSRGGSGLGLSIARGLAERNGGRLDLLDTAVGAALQLLLPTPA
jgi:signal transduction histidine kinase